MRENVSDSKIVVTGNTVIDALHLVTNKINNDKDLNANLAKELVTKGYDVTRLSNGRRLVLITGHRRENFGDGFRNICNALKALSEKYPDVDLYIRCILILMYVVLSMRLLERI